MCTHTRCPLTTPRSHRTGRDRKHLRRTKTRWGSTCFSEGLALLLSLSLQNPLLLSDSVYVALSFSLSFSVAPAIAVTGRGARLCVLSLVHTQRMRVGAHAHAQLHAQTHMHTFQDKAGGQEGDGDGEKDPKDEAVSFLPPLFVVR